MNAPFALAADLGVAVDRPLVVDDPDGFAWDGRKFRSLSAIAKAITGTNWNGHAFFGLKAPTKTSTAAKLEEGDA